MHDVTVLSDWRINADDELSIQLIRHTGLAAISRTLNPSLIRVVWPAKATEIYTQHFPARAATACQVFAGASTKLTQLKAQLKFNL
jgi:hypothetical protein